MSAASLRWLFPGAAKRGRAIQQTREDLAMDYQLVFSGDAGKRVLAHLAGNTNLLNTTAAVHPDGMMAALEMARLEGRRSVMLQILDQLGWSPADMIATQAEDEIEP